MRPVAQLACLTFAALAIQAEGFGPSLTVLIDFEKSPASSSIGEMKREVAQLMQRTGYNVDVKLKSEIGPADEFEDLVLVTFRGTCNMANYAAFLDERGPLAWTHTTEGQILPFSEIACDNVRRAVAGALWGGQRAKQDVLFGRALGRIVAHELYHIVLKSHAHDKKGVFQESLSGNQLIADRLESSTKDDMRRAVARWRR